MTIATPTVLDNVTQTTTSPSIASGTVAPSANALLIVAAGIGIGTNNGGTPASIGDTLSGGSLTWTKYELGRIDSSLGIVIAVFVAKCGATPGTGVITSTFNFTGNRRAQTVCQSASGFNTTPVAQSKTNGGTANTLVVTFDSTPATDSLVFAAIASRQASHPNIAPGTGFTELQDDAVSTNFWLEIMYDQDNADATADWTNTGTGQNVGIAIEIAAAAGAADDSMAQTIQIGSRLGVQQQRTGGARMVMI